MANRNFANSRIYTGHVMPVLIDCNFVVDSTNGNGLGIRSLKGPYVKNVFMQSISGGPPTPPPGSPTLGVSSTFALLGASAITNSGSSVITGDVGLYAGTSFTGFPPGVVIGTEHITDGTASAAQTAASAAYTDLSTRSSTVIPSALDGQTLTAGVYSFASGAASLAQSGNGTLTFSGSATDIFVIQTASTLTTGAGGTPTIAFTGGALASNVYWAIGSSATLNVSGTGAFEGTLIAQTSVTIDGGSGTARLFALTGAVTISAAIVLNVPPVSGGPTRVPGTPQPGCIVVQLVDGFSESYTGFSSYVSPLSGISLKVDNSALTAGTAYVITTLGNSTLAQWQALGVPKGLTPSVGLSFVALNNGGSSNTSTSRVMTTAPAGSGIMSIEQDGDPNLSISPNPGAGQKFGAQFIMCARNNTGVMTAPVDGTVISLAFLLGNSSIKVQGD
jgi:hypothetical protein